MGIYITYRLPQAPGSGGKLWVVRMVDDEVKHSAMASGQRV